MYNNFLPYTDILTHQEPDAIAYIKGNTANPLLEGVALFYSTFLNTLLMQVEVFHLPDENLPEKSGFFGMHIHEIGNCTLPFDKTGAHFNPAGNEHPYHAGDMPPLLSNNGYAWMSFYDGRLSISSIINKSLVIHSMRDDFTTLSLLCSLEAI